MSESQSRPKRRKPGITFKLLLVAGSSLLTLLLLEFAVRALIRHDEDGNRFFRWTQLKPHRLPVERTRGLIDKYLDPEVEKVSIYDPELGWAPKPFALENPAEGIGVRDPKAEITKSIPEGKLRISVFGGSYARFGEFAYDWSTLLEDRLNEAGIPTQVLNFGVGGYGMDQPLLRWRKQGRAYETHIVLLAFNGVNMERNVNLFRMFKRPLTGVAFFKPRFIVQDGKLELINSPTPAPSEVPDVIAHFPTWSWSAHETFYRPADYENRWWRNSILVSILEARSESWGTQPEQARFFAFDGQASQVALHILRAFNEEVGETGASFHAVHLPTQEHLETLQAEGEYHIQDLIDAVVREMPLIDLGPTVLAYAGDKPVGSGFEDGHYSFEFKQPVAKHIARTLVEKHPDLEGWIKE